MRLGQYIRAFVILAALMFGLSSVPVNATVISLTAFDQGLYRDSGAGNANITSYAVGVSGTLEIRNFFVFDLSSITDIIVGATLDLFNPTNGFLTVDSSETYEVVEVTSSITQLLAGNGGFGNAGGVAIFNDLGSGTVFGLRTILTSEINQVISVELNSNAVSALNSSTGLFALGGHSISLSGTTNEFGLIDDAVFAFTSSQTTTNTGRLILRFADVPEPTTLALFGIGLLGLGMMRRRKRTAR
jgi:hypothetical protein